MRILGIEAKLNFRANEIDDKSSKSLSFPIVKEKIGPVFQEHFIERDEFIRSGATLDVTTLKNLNIDNFRLIDSRSVRGQSLAAKPLQLFYDLKRAGIETVIDLRREGSEDSKYAKKCHAAGLNYLHFQTNEHFPALNPRGSNKISSLEFANLMDGYTTKMVDFFDEMSNGRVFVGCLLGLHRTDIAVSLNYLLNPIEPECPPLLAHMFLKSEQNVTGKRIGAVKNLWRNLTDEHKAKLGLQEGFKDILDVRIAKLRLMNLAFK